jgi:hypothetical protein
LLEGRDDSHCDLVGAHAGVDCELVVVSVHVQRGVDFDVNWASSFFIFLYAIRVIGGILVVGYDSGLEGKL